MKTMRNRFSCIGGALLPLLLLIGSMTTTSCVKKLTYVDPNPSEQNPSTPDDDKDENPDITVDQLKFKTVCLSADANEGIYGDVDFVADATGYNLTATITNYKADLSQLKVTFEAVADQVTANGTTQVSKETVNDFRQPVTFRLHTKDGQFRDFTLAVQNPKESYTGYPVLAIVTDGRAPVVSKEDWVKGRYVLDPQESRIERQAGPLQIKGRGHNSWTQDKKPYNIKLEEKAPMMGMPKHKRWCLLANAGDKSLFRNRVAYRLGQLTGLPWTPKTEFVDVMLNGKFVGNYLLTEQIRVDKNRVNIVEAQAGMKPEEVGYLLEFDRYVEENYFYTDLRQLPVIIKDPDEEMLTAEQTPFRGGRVGPRSAPAGCHRPAGGGVAPGRVRPPQPQDRQPALVRRPDRSAALPRRLHRRRDGRFARSLRGAAPLRAGAYRLCGGGRQGPGADLLRGHRLGGCLPVGG